MRVLTFVARNTAIMALFGIPGSALAADLTAGYNEIVVSGGAGSLEGGIPVNTSFSNVYFTPGNYSRGASAGGASVLETMVVSNAPIPSTLSSVSALPGTGLGAGAAADLRSFSLYYMQVNGAAGEATVRVNAFGEVGISAFTATTGLINASALFRLEKQFGGEILIDQSIDAAGSPDPRLGPRASAFTVDGDFQFVTNTPYVVRLRTILHLQSITGNGEVSGYANIDPTFSVAGPYTLQFSPGFGGEAGPGVPEPSTWALMFVGFGSAGAMLRSRRRATPV